MGTVDIFEVLGAENPPDETQTIAYGVSENAEGPWTVIHSANCARGAAGGWDAAVFKETTGGQLVQTLVDERIATVCSWCHSGMREHVLMLTRNGADHRKTDYTWTDCAILLYYEAWKRKTVDDWCLWLCEQDSETIRKNARKNFGWPENGWSGRGYAGDTGETPDFPYAVCFDAYAFDARSQILVAGDHVATNRHHRQPTCVSVHGLVPSDTYRRDDSRELCVPVSHDFNSQHLELAVALYENNERVLKNEAEQHELVAIAEKAVETAQLCLA